MTIRSPEFEGLLHSLFPAALGPELENAADKLTHFIDAYVTLRRTQAINAFKRACQAQGLTAIDKKDFDQLVKDIDRADRHRLPAGALAARARRIRHDDVLEPAAPVEEGTPEFTIREDEDLDRLLNSTASLLSGSANQDVGMAWYDDLQTVLRRLLRAQPADDAKTEGLWHGPSELPPDHRPVLAELKAKRKGQKPIYAVVCYHRTKKGVHDTEPAWFDPRADDTCEIVRWQHITA